MVLGAVGAREKVKDCEILALNSWGEWEAHGTGCGGSRRLTVVVEDDQRAESALYADTFDRPGVGARPCGTRSKRPRVSLSVSFPLLRCAMALSLPAWNPPTGQMPFVIVPDECVYVDQQTLKLQVCLCCEDVFFYIVRAYLEASSKGVRLHCSITCTAVASSALLSRGRTVPGAMTHTHIRLP